MKREDIERAADQSAFIETPDARERFLFSSGFRKGADWRINNVWHKPNEEPVSFCSLLLIENSNGEFDLEYKFDPATTKRWAYVKDLIPNMEE